MGAREAASEAQPERAGGPVTIGDLLDVSYPPLPLAGAEDVGLGGAGPAALGPAGLRTRRGAGLAAGVEVSGRRAYNGSSKAV